MIKPWSISTTVRNPERIRDFLRILKLLENKEWTRDTQKQFQVMLIQYKIYGYGSQQFYQGLSERHLKLMNNPEKISFEEAREILESKNYTGGGDMRGRQSFNPLEKMGLVYIDEDNKIKISAVGEYFLKENYDLGEVFFKSFLKWQLPNFDSDDFTSEEGFAIKPFIAMLHLISKVNKKWKDLGNEPVGISKKEFSLFIPTLINYKNIDSYAKKIIDLRISMKNTKKDKKKLFDKYAESFIQEFLNSKNKEIVNSTLKNVSEYTDNIIRYFRLTRYIYIRGNGFFIDLEPRREVEIKSLLNSDSGKSIKFKDRSGFIEYLSDINQPVLAWDTSEKLTEIIKNILLEIRQIEKSLNIPSIKERKYSSLDKKELHSYIEELREIRRSLQEKIVHKDSQEIENIKIYAKVLGGEIYKMEDRPLALEKYITFALNALNDALSIKPNYPVGDDNEPTNTAPGGLPDIECFYQNYNSICEVTMLRDRSQWYNEGQPVMRHLRDFENKNNEKETYCLFVAPELHIDTIETFWVSIKHGYRGKKQRIIPLSLKQFNELLNTLIVFKQENKRFSHEFLHELFKKIANAENIESSEEWISQIPKKLNDWKEEVLT